MKHHAIWRIRYQADSRIDGQICGGVRDRALSFEGSSCRLQTMRQRRRMACYTAAQGALKFIEQAAWLDVFDPPCGI